MTETAGRTECGLTTCSCTCDTQDMGSCISGDHCKIHAWGCHKGCG